ncbi:UNVERIFIED_CONTAM: hypothetical protein Slati_2265200 [Sesamum latifolium]|uniref:Uncharacterized protein n=1 Tax=Sesamum latifolium TaxID=2727402 RepID=A0AAW2WZG9_9LAMI
MNPLGRACDLRARDLASSHPELAACDQAISRPGELAPCELAVCDQASSRPAIWLARDLRASELAPSKLVAGDPASSRDAELATCELVALVHPMDFLLLALKQSNCLRN